MRVQFNLLTFVRNPLQGNFGDAEDKESSPNDVYIPQFHSINLKDEVNEFVAKDCLVVALAKYLAQQLQSSPKLSKVMKIVVSFSCQIEQSVDHWNACFSNWRQQGGIVDASTKETMNCNDA